MFGLEGNKYLKVFKNEYIELLQSEVNKFFENNKIYLLFSETFTLNNIFYYSITYSLANLEFK